MSKSIEDILRKMQEDRQERLSNEEKYIQESLEHQRKSWELERERRRVYESLNNSNSSSSSSAGGRPQSSSSVLQPWYDSLAVKPSAGLWTDLQILADGMNTDGDWDEIDLFGIVAALETDEQRLMPLKTTSGESTSIVGTMNLSVNGIDNPTSAANSGLDLKWNPTDDGVKYTLNSAYYGCFGITKASSVSSRWIMGSYYAGLDNDNFSVMKLQTSTTTLLLNSTTSINNSSLITVTKTGLSNAIKTFFIGAKTTDTTAYGYVNATNNNTSVSPLFIPTLDFGFMGYYDGSFTPTLTFASNIVNQAFGRGYIAGSSLIDHDRVAARLNTFFASRGLSISNY